MPNIVSLNRPGMIGAPQDRGKAPEAQDLLGFISQIVIPQMNMKPQAQASSAAAEIQSLPAKIAGLLEDDGKLPLSLQNMQASDLAEKIAVLLQQNGAAPQAAASPEDLLAAKIATMMQQNGTNAMASASPNDQLLAKISTLLQQNGLSLTDSAPANDQLAAKIAALLQNNGAAAQQAADLNNPLAAKIAAMMQHNGIAPQASALSKDQMAAKIAELLKKEAGNKIDPSMVQDLAALLASQIQNTPGPVTEDMGSKDLAALVKKIKDGDVSDGELAQVIKDMNNKTGEAADATTLLQVLKDKIAGLSQTTGDISAKDIAQLRTDIIGVLKDQGMDQPSAEHYLSDLAKFMKGEELPEQAMRADDADKAQADKASSAILAKVEEKLKSNDTPSAPAPAAAKKEAVAAQNPAPAPADIAPAPQPNVTAKAAGISLNPAIISAMANDDTAFKNDNSGMNGSGKQADPMGASINILKSDAADAANKAGFTNYLTAARGNIPTATTQMITLQMQRNIAAKINTMTIQLDPADLGKMDIKLKFGDDGSVRAHMTVDRPETLAILQRDAHHLEKALQQSGLSTNDKSLSFDLRQHQGQQQNLHGFNGQNKNNAEEFAAHMDGKQIDKAVQAQIAIQSYGYITQSGVNIMV